MRSACVSTPPHVPGDTGTTTTRLVVLLVMFNITNYLWETFTAVGIISDSLADKWDARLFFPLTEGFMFLPPAIVISVWMDVANSSLSRVKAKKTLQRTKTMIQLGTATFIVLLFLICEFSYLDMAKVVQLSAVGLSIAACGYGSAKLCKTLRAMGETSAGIADTVFRVSRSMGISLYMIFIGNSMMLASRTRKSDPANLGILGMTVSSFAKCFLNKAIFEYMVESSRAKQKRIINSENLRANHGIRPIVRLLSSIRTMQKLRTTRIAAHNEQKVSSASSACSFNASKIETKNDQVEPSHLDEDALLPNESKQWHLGNEAGKREGERNTETPKRRSFSQGDQTPALG